MSGSISKITHGIGWGGLSTVVNVSFQMIFMAVMARLLGPVEFGLIAIANVMLRFLMYFAQLGVGPALIQKTELHDGDIRAALSVSLGISILCTLIAVLIAPQIEVYFDMPMLASVIQALSLNFIMGGMSTISSSLLRRDMRFKQVAIIESCGYVFGYGAIGVILAYIGMGVWALVGAALSQGFLNMVMSYLFCRHEIGFRHRKHQRKHFFDFGARYSIIGFVEFLSGSLDSLIVGKLFGSSAVGVYGRATLLSSLPVQQPANIITRALFPIISRYGNQQQITSLQLTTLVVGSYAFSVSWGMVAAAPDLVGVILGEKWLEAIPVLQILLLAIAPQYLAHVVGVTLDAMGELKPKLRIQMTVLIIQIVAFFVLLPYGIRGIAGAIVFAEWIRFVLMSRLILRLLNPPIDQFKKIFSFIFLSGLCSYILIRIAADFNPLRKITSISLFFEIIAGCLALASMFWFGRAYLIKLPVVCEFVQRVPILTKVMNLGQIEKP